MSKRPPEKYEPGELSKTRGRLGDLSDEESERMKSLLGGEIGVERSPSEVDEAYDGLKNKRYEQAERSFTKKTAEDKAPSDDDAFVRYVKSRRRAPFGDRVKMNFLCARPEHNLKTSGNAFASVFSFVLPWRDRVNPEFIQNADVNFYKSIENFVISLRALLSVYRSIRKKPPAGWAYELLNELSEWNIEALSSEIGRLQQSPREWEFGSLRFLARYTFTPMLKNIHLKPQDHIVYALRTVIERIKKHRLKLPVSRDRLKSFFDVAVQELPIVFYTIKRRTYPLLMKLCSSGYESYEDFFTKRVDEILDFLGLNDENLPTPESIAARIKEEEKKGIGEELEDDEESGEGDVRHNRMPEVDEGLHILDALFPDAGWTNLESSPDFFAYFQSLFQFPRGFELIPPEDPLMPVLILTMILQEFYYGFRNIDFGVLRDGSGVAFGIKQEVERHTWFWYQYAEDVIGKRYIPLLYDYCRKLEQDFQFRNSEYGKKIASELMWLKRLYFIPFYTFVAVPGSRPVVDKNLPALHKTLSFLVPLFLRITEDLDSSTDEVRESIKNPADAFQFDVESIVSYRLKKYAAAAGAKPDNGFLIRTVSTVLSMLDTLVNNPISILYTRGDLEEIPLFRSADGKGFTPVYSVQPVDVREMLR